MTAIGAKQIGDGRGYWRVGWVAVIDGAEIMGVKFATKEEALIYAARVAEYEKGAATIREGATHKRTREATQIDKRSSRRSRP